MNSESVKKSSKEPKKWSMSDSNLSMTSSRRPNSGQSVVGYLLRSSSKVMRDKYCRRCHRICRSAQVGDKAFACDHCPRSDHRNRVQTDDESGSPPKRSKDIETLSIGTQTEEVVMAQNRSDDMVNNPTEETDYEDLVVPGCSQMTDQSNQSDTEEEDLYIKLTDNTFHCLQCDAIETEEFDIIHHINEIHSQKIWTVDEDEDDVQRSEILNEEIDCIVISDDELERCPQPVTEFVDYYLNEEKVDNKYRFRCEYAINCRKTFTIRLAALRHIERHMRSESVKTK